jgi:predicted RND superfamily exporter protein
VLLAGVVVAFATEFSVLWLARYREELEVSAPAEAAAVASRRIGPAVVASALALVLGFLLLAISPVPMVREFGLWSGTDLAFATLAVLVLLPPLATRFVRPRRPAATPASP